MLLFFFLLLQIIVKIQFRILFSYSIYINRFAKEYWDALVVECNNDENTLYNLLIIELNSLPTDVLQAFILYIESTDNLLPLFLQLFIHILNCMDKRGFLSDEICSNCLSFMITLPIRFFYSFFLFYR